MYNERSINYNQQQPALTRIDECEPTVERDATRQPRKKEHDHYA